MSYLLEGKNPTGLIWGFVREDCEDPKAPFARVQIEPDHALGGNFGGQVIARRFAGILQGQLIFQVMRFKVIGLIDLTNPNQKTALIYEGANTAELFGNFGVEGEGLIPTDTDLREIRDLVILYCHETLNIRVNFSNI
jgi:hypothetical protein